MKYLLLITNDENLWTRLSVNDQGRVVDRMNQFTDELKSAGKWVACGGLNPSTDATTVRLTESGDRVVVDGLARPIGADNALVTGYFVIEAATMDEAIAWTKKMPIIAGAVEIRSIGFE